MENIVEQMKGRVSEEEGEAPKRGKKSSLKENNETFRELNDKACLLDSDLKGLCVNVEVAKDKVEKVKNEKDIVEVEATSVVR